MPEKTLAHDVADRRVWTESLATGNPIIDAATPKLLAELVTATELINSNPVFTYLPTRTRGTFIHSAWAEVVRQLAASGQLSGSSRLDIEVSRRKAKALSHGTAGSIRADFVLRDKAGQILAIYDVKTGRRRLSDPRVSELLRHFNAPRNTKVFSFSLENPRHTAK